MRTAKDVLQFWFVDHSDEHWFGGGPAFDAELAAGFAETHQAVAAGEAWRWRATPEGRLAEIVVLDQFSRQLFRGEARAFSQDAMALALAQEMVTAGLDAAFEPKRRMFIYLPFMHSESLVIHEETIRLYTSLGDEKAMTFELQHVDVLRRFGRYPRRNAALGRTSTPEELAFLASGETKW